MSLEPIKNVSTSATGATSELQEIKTKEAGDVKTSEAKALEEAKTNENTEVSVAIADAQPKEEKKGFFAKLWDAIKAPFVSDNTAGKTVGGGVGVLGGAGIGFLLGGPIGAIIGGVVGLVAGFFGGNAVQEAVENDGQLKDGEQPEVQDAKANTTEEIIDENGNKTIVEYDENGNKVKESLDINNDGTIEDVTTYEYNEAGQLVKENVDYTGEDGKADGVPEYSVEYEYDENGNAVKETTKDAEGNTTNIYTKTYDENGNVASSLFDRDADGVKNGSDEYHEFKYDEKGQMIENNYDGSDGKWVSTYEYDENGNKTAEHVDYDGDGVADKTYKFDEDGNKIYE